MEAVVLWFSVCSGLWIELSEFSPVLAHAGADPGFLKGVAGALGFAESMRHATKIFKI